LEKANSWGPTGGIGFDLDDISAFLGYSYYFGQNIVITGGAAFHKQLRLDSKYDVGQVVPAALNTNDINNSYYRLNPFISLTFALDNNPFKK